MNFDRIVIGALMLGALGILSCSDENELATPSCTLTTLRSWTGDSIVFSFDGSNKLKQVVSYGGKKPYEVTDLEYDANERLKKVVKKFVYSTETVYQNYELSYDNAGMPKSLSSWGANTTLPAIITSFTHDSKGRLVKREKQFFTSRYEYNDQDNVIKFFYTTYGEAEELGRENLSFDNKSRVFASIPDYAFLNIYVYGSEPSKNHALTASIKRESEQALYSEPQEVNFAALYDDQGMIYSYYRTGPRGAPDELVFQQAFYECK